MNYDLTFFEENGWATIEELSKHKYYKDTINSIYRDYYSGKSHIGECVNLYCELKPTSVQDFRDKLEAYAEEHKDLKLQHRGPTNIELFELAKSFREDCCKARPALKQYDVMFFYNNLLHHQTTETFYGCSKEERWRKYLELNNIKSRHSTSEEDGEFCADVFILDENNKEVTAIQIKPISFLRGKRGKIIQDRNKILTSIAALKSKMGVDLKFAVYCMDINKWLKNTSANSFMFQFDELFEINNGNVEAKNCYKDIDTSVWESLPN